MMNIKDLFDGFQAAIQFIVRRVVIVGLTFGAFYWATDGKLGELVLKALRWGEATLTPWSAALGALDTLIGIQNRQNAFFIVSLFAILGVLHALYGALNGLANWCPIHPIYHPSRVLEGNVNDLRRAFRYYAPKYDFEDLKRLAEYKASKLSKSRSGWWSEAIWISRSWILIGVGLVLFNFTQEMNYMRGLILCFGCLVALVICAAIEARVYRQTQGIALREAVTVLIAEAGGSGAPLNVEMADMKQDLAMSKKAAVTLDLLIPYFGGVGTWWLNRGQHQWRRTKTTVDGLVRKQGSSRPRRLWPD